MEKGKDGARGSSYIYTKTHHQYGDLEARSGDIYFQFIRLLEGVFAIEGRMDG